MPGYSQPAEPLPPTAAKAVRVLGAYPVRVAIIRELIQRGDGATTGDISRSLGIPLQTAIRHIKELESDGIVIADTGRIRSGRRVLYQVDQHALTEQLERFSSYLHGE